MTGYKDIEMLKSLHEGDQTRKRQADSSVVGGPSHPSEATVLSVPKYYSRELGKCSHPAGTWFVFVQRQEQAAMPSAHLEGPREQSWDSQCGICGGQSGAGRDFSPSTCVVRNFCS